MSGLELGLVIAGAVVLLELVALVLTLALCHVASVADDALGQREGQRGGLFDGGAPGARAR